MNSFAEHYLKARGREGRLLRKEDLVARPLAPPTASQSELRSRNFTYRCLRRHLQGRRRRGSSLRRILEIGCGSGWLSARLSQDLNVEVVGIDIAPAELLRAQIGSRECVPCPRFVAASFSAIPIKPHSFDVVVAAASAQYSPRLDAFVELSLAMCADEGELLIADTPFYLPDELALARQRTAKHYQDLGCEEMTQHYHHHLLADLAALRPQWIYAPRHFANRVVRKVSGVGSPFPIVSIRAREQAEPAARASSVLRD